MQQALDLARGRGGEPQPQDADERRALEVAQHLQRVAARSAAPPSAACEHSGPEHARRRRRVGVPLRLDLRRRTPGTASAPGGTPSRRAGAARTSARSPRARPRPGRRRARPSPWASSSKASCESAEPSQKRSASSTRYQAAAVECRSLRRPRCGSSSAAWVTTSKVRPTRQHQVHVAERLEPAAEARARPADALGDHPQLAEARGEHGQHPVRLAEVHAAQHDRLGLVEARAAHGLPDSV